MRINSIFSRLRRKFIGTSWGQAQINYDYRKTLSVQGLLKREGHSSTSSPPVQTSTEFLSLVSLMGKNIIKSVFITKVIAQLTSRHALPFPSCSLASHFLSIMIMTLFGFFSAFRLVCASLPHHLLSSDLVAYRSMMMKNEGGQDKNSATRRFKTHLKLINSDGRDL